MVIRWIYSGVSILVMVGASIGLVACSSIPAFYVHAKNESGIVIARLYLDYPGDPGTPMKSEMARDMKNGETADGVVWNKNSPIRVVIEDAAGRSYTVFDGQRAKDGGNISIRITRVDARGVLSGWVTFEKSTAIPLRAAETSK